MGRILVIGKAIVENVFEAPFSPCEGEKVSGTKYEVRPGGRAGASAYAIRLAGVESAICAKVGKDGNAQRLRHFLFESGIDTGALFTDPSGQTAYRAYICKDKFSEPGIIDYSGVSDKLSEEELEKAIDSQAQNVLLQCDLSEESVIAAAEIAKKLEKRLFVDLSMTESISVMLSIKSADIVLFSEKSIEKSLGIFCDSMEKCLKASIELSKYINAKYYLIKLKDRGLFFYDGTYYNLIFPCDAPERENRCAADIFGAILYSYYIKTGSMTASAEAAVIADHIVKENPLIYVPSESDIKSFVKEKMLNVHF